MNPSSLVAKLIALKNNSAMDALVKTHVDRVSRSSEVKIGSNFVRLVVAYALVGLVVRLLKDEEVGHVEEKDELLTELTNPGWVLQEGQIFIYEPPAWGGKVILAPWEINKEPEYKDELIRDPIPFIKEHQRSHMAGGAFHHEDYANPYASGWVTPRMVAALVEMNVVSKEDAALFYEMVWYYYRKPAFTLFQHALDAATDQQRIKDIVKDNIATYTIPDYLLWENAYTTEDRTWTPKRSN